MQKVTSVTLIKTYYTKQSEVNLWDLLKILIFLNLLGNSWPLPPEIYCSGFFSETNSSCRLLFYTASLQPLYDLSRKSSLSFKNRLIIIRLVE